MTTKKTGLPYGKPGLFTLVWLLEEPLLRRGGDAEVSQADLALRVEV